MIDARGVQRLLEKIYGLADTATTVGAKSAEVMLREPRLSDEAKRRLVPLYQEESLRRTRLHCALGLAVCVAIQSELQDEAAREQMEFFRARLEALDVNAQQELNTRFPASTALELK